MNASGATMAAGSFAAVSASNGACTLADFSVQGYEAPVWDDDEDDYVGGCPGGRFIVQFLSSSGTTESTYYWIDNGEKGPGWFASAGGTAIAGGASSVAIAAGQAMWIQGKGLKLVSAGAVNEADIAFPTRSSGASAVGNATPVDLTLGRLTVSGYEAPVWDDDEDDYVGGCPGGRFIVQFLTSSGTTESTYYWIDNGEKGPGWFASAGGTAIDGGATSVSIPAGKGLWVQGKGLTLNIPAPEL